MQKSFKIFQVNLKVKIKDSSTGSTYEYDIFQQLDQEDYNNEQLAESALEEYLKNNPLDQDEYTILKIFKN